MRRAIPVRAVEPSSAGEQSSRGTPAIRSAPERFFETWLDAIGGFLFSVLLPIPIYATGEPFAQGVGATEQTILATAAAYVIVWYCGRRLDAFPRATLQGNIGYLAPVAAISYAAIAVLLVLLRSDYSRVQLFGSGLLTILWMAFVAQLRGALPDPQLCGGALGAHPRDAGEGGLPLADLRGCRGDGHPGRCHGRRSWTGPHRGPGCRPGRRGDRRSAGARPALHGRDHDRPHAARRPDAQRIRRPAAVAPVPGGAPWARAAADRARAAGARADPDWSSPWSCGSTVRGRSSSSRSGWGGAGASSA